MRRLRRKYWHIAGKSLTALIYKKLLPINKRKTNIHLKQWTKRKSRQCGWREAMPELGTSEDPEGGEAVITC